MKKYLVLYCMPNEGLQEWMKMPEAERKTAEDKMKSEWDTWAAANKAALVETAGAGKTKRVTEEGVANVSNDVMMYSIVQADSDDAAAKMFEGHPHLGIPGGWVDVMPANVLPEMK